MTPPFRLSRRARTDLNDIGRYTAKVWGKAQRNLYLGALYRRIAWLSEDPARGRPREEVGAGVFSYPQGAHLIFYVVSLGQIFVIGVPHEAMDLHAHFEGDDLE